MQIIHFCQHTLCPNHTCFYLQCPEIRHLVHIRQAILTLVQTLHCKYKFFPLLHSGSMNGNVPSKLLRRKYN